MTARLLKSPGPFSVFWPILKMMSSRWSRIVFLFPSLPVPLPQLVLPSPSCSIIFFSSLARSFFTFFYVHPLVWLDSKVHYSANLLDFFWLLLGLVVSSRLDCISKSQRRLCVSFSRNDSGLFITINLYGQINYFHKSLCITFPTKSCLVLYSFCANLLILLIIYDWIFCLYHRITYIYYFVISCLLLL